MKRGHLDGKVLASTIGQVQFLMRQVIDDVVNFFVWENAAPSKVL